MHTTTEKYWKWARRLAMLTIVVAVMPGSCTAVALLYVLWKKLFGE